MKEPYSDEILSAYVDSELSAQERAEVERWLETSPAAREKLEEFRRLSGLFASLPRTEAPQEFPTKVMQLAERRMLLPESLAMSTRRRINRWVFAVGAPIASAAVLFLIVFLSQRAGDPEFPNDGLARKDHPAPVSPGPVRQGPGERGLARNVPNADGAVDMADSRRGEFRKSGALLAQSDDDKGDQEVSERSAALKLRSVDKAVGDPAAPVAAASPAGGGAGFAPPAMAANKRAAAKTNVANSAAPVPGAPFDDGAAGLPQLAELNRAIEKLGEKDGEHELVSVVKVYVADSAEGMVLLQNVFADNDVRSEGEGLPGKRDRATRKATAQDSPAESAGKEALYVVAEPRQLIAAFTEILSRDEPGIRLAVEAPVEIAALDVRLQEQMKQVSPEVAGQGAGRREMSAKDSVAGDKVPAPADGKPAADEGQEPSLSKTDDKTDAKTDSKPGAKAGATNAVKPLLEKKSIASPKLESAKTQAQSKVKETPDSEKQANGQKGVVANLGANRVVDSQNAADQKADGSKAPVKKAADLKAEGQSEAGENAVGQKKFAQSRQLVVPMPEALRDRAQLGAAKVEADRDADSVEKAKSRFGGKASRGDEQAKAETEEAQPAPSLVRVLFLIELEPAPASPPAATPRDGK